MESTGDARVTRNVALAVVVLEEFAPAGKTLIEQSGVNLCLIRVRRINIGSGNHQGIGED
jgi:hypothetical protein